MSDGQDARDPRPEEREPEGSRGSSGGAADTAKGQEAADGRTAGAGENSAEGDGDGGSEGDRRPAGSGRTADAVGEDDSAAEPQAEDGEDTAPDREPEQDAEPEAETDPEAEVGSEPETDRDAEAEPETDRDADAEPQTETDAEPAAAERRPDPARGPDHGGVPEGDGLARLRALVTPHGQNPRDTHAGNGTVNDGRDEQGPDGLDSDELHLRTLLHQAVQDVEPSDGTLDYLRRAVPARRARKRQALVGAAAAALFLGTAVPAVVHVSTTSGSAANPSAVGHASQAQGGTGQGKDAGNGETTAGGASDEVGDDRKDPTKEGDKAGASTGTGTGASEGADPSAGTTADAPACTADQLGPATATSAAPDSAGAVYGSFRVTNVSGAACVVDGPGTVGATPQGAADPAKIGTARHVAGDAAAALPDPSLEAATVVLKPGEAYEVRFAWVPSETCPVPGDTAGGGTGGPSADPTPTGEPTNTAGASTGTGTAPGTTTQLLRQDGGTEGSVAVTYTTTTGSGSATTTVTNACAGTVYWTGLLTLA
ncbi:hypothetical protein [Streptomyces althioticus]|uniref:hypothetical protein n=1 Tax=Streptomyces althioticus TaxID=83380 RepID=UPI0033EA10A5|nr:hypothetical protein OG872_15400 [Streptomyces althioticus]